MVLFEVFLQESRSIEDNDVHTYIWSDHNPPSKKLLPTSLSGLIIYCTVRKTFIKAPRFVFVKDCLMLKSVPTLQNFLLF